jgi:predicted SAM-dependent methyltransferase
MLSIVIPTMTPKLVSACVDSIAKYTDLTDIEIIVVANGCPPTFRAELDNQDKPLRYVWYDKPLGAVVALNEGIKEAGGEFILLLNDDCEILPCPKNSWLTALLEPFSDPKVMCTGPFKMAPFMGEGGQLSLSKEDEHYGFIIFFMALIKRQAFDELGLLDETLLCGVDVDFCFKLRRKGYLIQQVPKEQLKQVDGEKFLTGTFPVWHQGEGTVHDFYGFENWRKILQKDTDILNARYGVVKQPVRLNIGCGDVILPGWVNCDLYNPKADLKCDARKIPYEDNTVDEIYASHLIEHFDFYEGHAVIKEWYRVLKPGGKLAIECPDLLNLCKVFATSGPEVQTELYVQFYGYPWIPGQQHKFLYTEQALGTVLGNIGFKDVHREPALRYINLDSICLKMVGTK